MLPITSSRHYLYYSFYKGDTSSSSSRAGKKEETWMPGIANQSTWDSAIRFTNYHITFHEERKLETSVEDPSSWFLVAGSRIRIHIHVFN
jgi:hypothetical protein